MDKVYSDFKDWTLKISNKFDVEIVFKFGIIKINFEFLFNKNNYFFFQIFYFKFLATFLLFTTFPWICTFFPHFFPKKFLKWGKFKTKKNMVVKERRLVQLFNAFTKLCYFYFSKKNEGKIYYYIINFLSCHFFSSYIISHLYYCMIHVVKQTWYWKLNGYVDYVIYLFFLSFLPLQRGNNINKGFF